MDIRTRYVGPDNTRGTRVLAYRTDLCKRRTVSWDYSLGTLGNHEAAALDLARRIFPRGVEPILIETDHSPTDGYLFKFR